MEDNKINIEENDFKLSNIITLDDISDGVITYYQNDVSEGLALEKKKNGHYYVIAFLKYDENEERVKLESVGERFIKEVATFEEWKIARELIIRGNEMILKANEKEND